MSKYATGWSIMAWFQTGSNDSSLLQNIQSVWDHSASYAMGTALSFHRNKVVAGWSYTSIPHMPSWHAQNNFILQCRCCWLGLTQDGSTLQLSKGKSLAAEVTSRGTTYRMCMAGPCNIFTGSTILHCQHSFSYEFTSRLKINVTDMNKHTATLLHTNFT